MQVFKIRVSGATGFELGVFSVIGFLVKGMPNVNPYSYLAILQCRICPYTNSLVKKERTGKEEGGGGGQGE